MKKKNIFFIILLVMVYCISLPVSAATLKQYTFEAPEVLQSSEKPVNTTNYSTEGPSVVYDFFTEDGKFNVVYTSKTKVYWSTFNENMEVEKTRSWDMLYDDSGLDDMLDIFFHPFGGAIYDNGYLYVVYTKPASGDTSAERYEKNVLAVGKYDKDGNRVALQEYKGKYLNASGNIYDYQSGIQIPYYGASSSMTINNGVLTLFFGGNMYMAHQSSLIVYIDTETLDFISNMRDENLKDEDRHRYATTSTHTISHSLGQRIITTSDGGYLLMEVGDAGVSGATRGLMLSKIYEDHYTEDTYDYDYFNIETRKVAHFSEGSNSTWGYNVTHQALGNLIEVDDGYLYIGSLDKELSATYGATINNPWDIFVQKYRKDFQNTEDVKEMQMFTTDERVVTGEKSDYEYGRLYLTGSEVDYGMKWLTALNNETIILIRAVSLEDGNIAILWEQNELEPGAVLGYTLASRDGDIYYMVIDSDGNIVKEASKLDGVTLTNEEHYAYKDGIIYWTTTLGNEVTVNTLNVYNNIQSVTLDKESASVEYGEELVLNATINPTDTDMDKTLKWESSNPSIATVDENGKITAKFPGKATITVTTVNGKTATCEVTVTGEAPYIMGDLNNSGRVSITDVVMLVKLNFNKLELNDYYLAVGDMNHSGRISVTDVVLLVKTIFGKI